MILRAVAIAGGLTGAAGLSQYPEFSQQYTQNLAGQVEALSLVVSDFDASAARSGLSRDEALAELRGTQFLDDRRADMTRTFARLYALSTHLGALEEATPMARLTMPHRHSDRDTFAGTWAQFKPAIPLTSAGAVSAGVGFLGGLAVIGGVLSLLAWPFRRAKRRKDAADAYSVPPLSSVRADPPVTRKEPDPSETSQ